MTRRKFCVQLSGKRVSTTEAGTDIVEVTRYDKLSISAQFGVTGAWAKVFKTFSKSPSIQVRMYDTESETYETRTMRIRSYRETLKKGSETLTAVNGVWEVSFTLKEF